MLEHMRTSINIADGLLEEAKRHARQQNTTLRALVEEGLRELLGRERSAEPYRYEPVTYALPWRASIDPRDWSQVKEVLDAQELHHTARPSATGRGA